MKSIFWTTCGEHVVGEHGPKRKHNKIDEAFLLSCFPHIFLGTWAWGWHEEAEKEDWEKNNVDDDGVDTQNHEDEAEGGHTEDGEKYEEGEALSWRKKGKAMKRGQKVQNLAYLFPSLFKAEFAVELEIFVLFLCLVHHGLDQVLSCSHRHHEQRCQNGSNLGRHSIGICLYFYRSLWLLPYLKNWGNSVRPREYNEKLEAQLQQWLPNTFAGSHPHIQPQHCRALVHQERSLLEDVINSEGMPPPLCQTGKHISNISNNTFQKGASLIPWKGPWWLGRKDRQVSISKSICLSPISSCNSRAGLQEGTPRSMWCWKYCMCKYRLIIDPWKLWKFFTFPRYNLVFQSDNICSHRPQSRRWRPTKSADEFLLNCTFGS